MKKTCLKIASVAVMLALVLSGCSLIEVDQVMQADEDFAALKKDYSSVLASYDGGEITVADIVYDFDSEYSYLSYLYSMYGYTMDDATTQDLMDEVVKSHMETRATIAKADELGISLTEEEIAQCTEDAENSYQAAYDAAYEAAADAATEELRIKQVEFNLYSAGNTKEFFQRQQEWTKLLEKVGEVVKSDITEISEEDLEARLAEHAQNDQTMYENNSSSYESAMLDENTFVSWNPTGYRTVKHILLQTDQELIDAVVDARDALSTAADELVELNDEKEDAGKEDAEDARPEDEIQADIDAKNAEIAEITAERDKAQDACIASVQDKLDEIYLKLEEGADFDELMAEYGEDPGMKSEPAMTVGYYVSNKSTKWDSYFKAGATRLKKVGDYTEEPVVSSSGVHIIYYASDVEAGQVSLDDVRDEFYDIALDEAKEEYMADLVQEWIKQLNPKYNVDEYFAKKNK